MSDSQLTFNILFLPGTVRELSLFLLTLQDRTKHTRFNIWSNGCKREENDLLYHFAQRYDRCQFEVFSETLLPHGEVLTELQRNETSHRFAFMDSDIFATGEFMSNLERRLEHATAVFSCPPIWSCGELDRLPAGFEALSGIISLLNDGSCVGNSYLAIYDNDALSDLIRKTGLTFSKITWPEIPTPIQQVLRQNGMEKVLYDTGKLLNILLAIDGHRLEFAKSPNLVHIGGISGTVKAVNLNENVARPSMRHRINIRLPRLLRTVIGQLRGQDSWSQGLSSAELTWQSKKSLRRKRTSLELTSFLRAKVNGRVHQPDLAGLPRQVKDAVVEVESKLSELYIGHRNELRSLGLNHVMGSPSHRGAA